MTKLEVNNWFKELQLELWEVYDSLLKNQEIQIQNTIYIIQNRVKEKYRDYYILEMKNISGVFMHMDFEYFMGHLGGILIVN